MRNTKSSGLYVAVAFVLLVAAGFFVSGNYADAFSIRSAFRNDAQFFSAIFDNTIATSSATSSLVFLNTSTPPVINVNADGPILFGSASGTVNIGDTVTVSSSLQDVTNATNTTILAQTLLPAVKIASVRGGLGSNNLDEYVLLYNQMGSAYSASGTVYLHVVKGASDTSLPLSFTTTTIPGYGFFLITSGSGYSGGISPDATYSTSSDMIASSTTAVYINTTSTPNVNILDKVEWGPGPQITTSTNATTTFASTVADAALPNGNVLIRKAISGSTSSTMATGGADSNKGNSYDTRSNSQNFVVVSSTQATIKNSMSPKEFPFSGGRSDTTVPVVMGSFPSGAPGEMVPTDLPFIGFGFGKPLNPTTVTSSTVSLVVQGQVTNLCSSISYTNMPSSGPPGQCNLSPGTLVAGTTYVFTIKGASSTPSVADFAGSPLFQPPGSNPGQFGNANHDYQLTFSPAGGFTRTPTVPPSVLGTYPGPGSSAIPTNITKVVAGFSQAMDATSFGGVTLAAAAGGGNILLNASATLASDGKSVSIPLSTTLVAGNPYILTFPPTVKNSNGAFLPGPFVTQFTAGAAADTTGPLLLGRLPNIATGVPVNATDVHAATDDNLDPSTVTTTTVQVADALGNVVPGDVSYDPLAKEMLWNGKNVFQPNTTYTVTLNASGTTPSVKNISGLALQDNDGVANSLYQFSFTTGGADTTGPGVLFANANGFSVAVTFDEGVKKLEAESIANYALLNGTSSVSLSSMNGQIVTYDAVHRTATLNNVALTPGNSFTVTVANIHDLSNNLLDAAKASFSGTVQASTMNGGGIGVGGGFIKPSGDMPTAFSAGTFGFVPQPGVRPFNMLAGFTSTYGIDVPISKQIVASGKVILTFPASFTLANAAADSFSPANNDINGPGTGTVTISSVTGNDTAHTVTVTLGATPTRGGADTHDFLHFDISGIGNSPVPNTSNGYTVDMRTVNGTSTLESLTSKPFFITAAGAGSLTVSFTASGATGGTASVYLFSPQTGPLSSSTTAFTPGSATTTFANLPNGTYNIMTDPIVALTGGVFLGQASPVPVTVNGATSKSLTLSATGSSASSTININATVAGKKISVFAGGPLGYVDIATSTVNGTTTVVLYYPGNGDYMVGIGPQINKTFMGPPPSPDYILPQPVKVTVAGGLASRSTVNFSLVAAGITMPGSVTDASNKAVANANVFAYSPQGGFGTFGQSGSDGTFSLKVTAGSYKIGASAPGFPGSQDIPVTVDSGGNLFVNGATASSSITIKLSKPGTKISGSVTDGTNAVQGAQVWAYCDPGTVSNSCFGPNGHAESQTDSSGAYTLYVGNGTWKVGAFIPGYGQQPEISVTVSGSDASSQNFQPSATATFKSVSGTACTNNAADCTGGTGISGATVRIDGTDPNGRFFTNTTISGSDGTYTFSNVPAGSATSYRVRGFAPTLGEFPATAPFNVNTLNVTGKDLVVGAGRSVTVSVLNAPSTFDAFMKFTNTTSGISNFLGFHNNTSGTIQLPNGSAYTLDARSPGFSFSASDLAKTSGTAATYSTSTGQLDLTSGASTVLLSLTYPTSTLISGSVTDASSTAVGNAWVDVSNSANGLHFGTQANTSGTYSLAVQNGSFTIAAYSPGYLTNSKSLIISNGTVTLGASSVASTSVNLSLTKSSLTISGTITTNGTAAPGALVKGVFAGGGTSVAVASADGTYSLPVSAGTWTISAVSDGYQGASYAGNPVVISASSVTGATINLTTTRTLAAPTAQSITPSQGGTLRNSSGTLELQIPANALGSSANSGQVKATETSNLIQTATTKPIGLGQDIKAYDSSNNAITTLNDNVTISFTIASSTFAQNGIVSTSTAAKLKLGYFDSSLGDWVPLLTTITYADGNGVQVAPNATLSNVDHILLSAQVSHFSTFGPIIPTDSIPPSAPSGVGATVTNRNIVVSWTAPTTNSDGSTPFTDLMEFEIYRDTSASGNFATQVNTSQVASGTASFTDPNPTVGTTYYYEVTAVDTSGNQSSKSSATTGVVITASTVSSGGGAPPSGGGGGGGVTPTATSTTTTATTTTTTVTTTTTTTTTAPAAATPTTPVVTTPPQGSAARPALPAPAAPQAAAGIKITRTLTTGTTNTQVRELQKLLAKDKSLYPEGSVTGYFGPATLRAVQRFQKKYGIVSSGPSYGVVGVSTRAKLQEVFGAPAAQPSAAVPQPRTSGVTDKAALQAQLQDLERQLQELLKQVGKTKR